MRIHHIYITKEGEPMANPEMEYPEKPEAKYEHAKAGIYRHTQWYKETGGYKDPTEWFNHAVEKYHSGLLPFEDIDSILWYITRKANHSEWSWAFEGAKRALKTKHEFRSYKWYESINNGLIEQLPEGPVRNEYGLIYQFGAEKMIPNTLIPVDLEVEVVEQQRSVLSDEWTDKVLRIKP